jgi:hypothetical protein
MKALGVIVMVIFLLVVGLGLFMSPDHPPIDTTPAHIGDNVHLREDYTLGCPSPFEVNGFSSFVALMRAQPGPRKSTGTLADEFVAHRQKACYHLDGHPVGTIEQVSSDGGKEAFRIHLKQRDQSLWFARDDFTVTP